nr:S-layer family protein [Mastigocoleus sp. MO_167.B18]
LDIGGSFIGSTADSIEFADGQIFSASQPNPILSIDVPIGLQFGSNPNSTISIQGNGNNLAIERSDSSLSQVNRPEGLHYQNPNGQSLILAAGQVELEGGNITLPGGRIELWSINEGQISLVDHNGRFQVEAGQQISYGDIKLSQAASIDASSDRAGDIQVRGRNINLEDGSVILSNTLGSDSGAELNIFGSESVTVQGFVLNSNAQVFSGILADVVAGASGTGSNISVTTPTLNLIDGGQISSGTFGNGNAGVLNIQTQKTQIISGSTFGPSGLFAPVAPGARGTGGNLNIETTNLQIIDGGQVFTDTLGFGQAGDLNIKAENIEVTGVGLRSTSNISASVRKISSIPEPIATFLGAGFGDGGNLNIETNTLRVTDSGQIAVSTSGSGKAGKMKITANSIDLIGATERSRSGLFANAVQVDGQGGNLAITSDRLTIRDGATINVSNFLSSDPENLRGLAGTGAVGNIEINSSSILLDNQSTITADSNAGDEGNIAIQSQNLQMRQGSKISANARNSAQGGNITINTDTLVGLENSDITANAQQGVGGRVILNTEGIFGIQFREQLTDESDITSTSQLGTEFNGVVEINYLQFIESLGLPELPQNLADLNQQIVASCSPSKEKKVSQFVITGRGGMRTNPTEVIVNPRVWKDLRDLSNIASTAKVKPNNISVNSPVNNPTNSDIQPIIEAQRLIVNTDGEVELVAHIPKATVQSPLETASTCG